MERSPGDSDHSPSGGREGAVPGAVSLVSAGGRVGGVTVELDDEAPARPREIDLEVPSGRVDEHVQARPGEACSVEEGEEAVLELAAGDVGADATLREDRSERLGSPVPR